MDMCLLVNLFRYKWIGTRSYVIYITGILPIVVEP